LWAQNCQKYTMSNLLWGDNLRRPNAIPKGVGGTDWPITIRRLPSPPPLTYHWHGILGLKLSPLVFRGRTPSPVCHEKWPQKLKMWPTKPPQIVMGMTYRMQQDSPMARCVLSHPVPTWHAVIIGLAYRTSPSPSPTSGVFTVQCAGS
jgi:hypothetical protein